MQGGFGRVVAPVAGKSSDERVIGLLPKLISAEGGVVTFLYVVAVPQSMPLDAELPLEIEKGENALRRAESELRRSTHPRSVEVVTELLQARAVGPAIVDEAIERKADAIVMTAVIHRSHGRNTLGETANHVLLNAGCEVVVIRVAQGTELSQGVPWG
ncbi:MAG: universal stress protein [Thermomicrobiales bacterium]